MLQLLSCRNLDNYSFITSHFFVCISFFFFHHTKCRDLPASAEHQKSWWWSFQAQQLWKWEIVMMNGCCQYLMMLTRTKPLLFIISLLLKMPFTSFLLCSSSVLWFFGFSLLGNCIAILYIWIWLYDTKEILNYVVSNF